MQHDVKVKLMGLRIAVLISGGGTTLANLISWHKRGSLQAEICHVISSNPQAKGLQYAIENEIPYMVFELKEFSSVADFSQAIFDQCRQSQVDLVVMGGFLKQVLIPKDFENRVINIHPSLIPAFCGKGMYGIRVHRAVIEFGCKLSGCTVHFVDNQFDHGPIIAQVPIEVLPEDTAETLTERIFQAECVIYPQVINAIAENRVSVEGRRVKVGRDNNPVRKNRS